MPPDPKSMKQPYIFGVHLLCPPLLKVPHEPYAYFLHLIIFLKNTGLIMVFKKGWS